MGGSEVPPEHLATPAAFQANDVIAIDGSTDRHSGGPLSLNFGCRLSESRECPIDSRDQFAELVGPDLVSPNICADDIGGEFSTE
jgi:hypothetical protein